MKYWTYYTDVVRYLERIEAGQSQKAEAPAYLVWQDGDGPSMIIGPGVEWYRGDGPPPDIDAITVRVGRLPARPRRTPPGRNKKRRATACRPRSTRPATQCWQSKTWRTPPACRVEPLAHHNPDPTNAPAFRPQERRTKGVRIFRNPLKPAHPAPRNNRAAGASLRSRPQITHPSSPRPRRPQPAGLAVINPGARRPASPGPRLIP